MRKFGTSVIAVALVCAAAGFATGMDDKKPAAGGAQAQGDQAQMWAEMMKLAPEHTMIKPFVGTWNVEAKFWMDPTGEPTTSKGTFVVSSVYEGRFVNGVWTSQMQGMPFQGMWFLGYNKDKKQFESIWMDNMSTGIMFDAGKADESGKTFTFHGSTEMMGQTLKMKTVYTWQGNDKFTMDSYILGEGNQEIKNMAITYTRSSDAKPALPTKEIKEKVQDAAEKAKKDMKQK